MTLKDIKTCSFNNTKDSNILNVKVKTYTECGYCSDNENGIELRVSWQIYAKWLYLSNRIGSKEWGGVFTVKDNNITDFKIPKQEVSSSSVEFKEEIGGNGIVHSHHKMGAFHSVQDDKQCRNLYDYSIVLSNGSGYTASKRVKLPCGAFGYVNVKLIVADCPEDIDLAKITEKKIVECQPELSFDNHGDMRVDAPPCMDCKLFNKCDECQFVVGEERCFYCESLKCKTCKFAIDNRIEAMLPFCGFCEDAGFCGSCSKLAKYLDNYPEEREKFELFEKEESEV